MNGIWYAIFSKSITKGIIISFRFSLGKWKKELVLGKPPAEPDTESPIEKFDIH